MAKADGSIIVDTELNTKPFTAHSKELNRAIQSLNTKVESLGPTMQKAVGGSTNALTSFDNKAETLEQTIEKIENEMENLGQQRIPTDDFQWLQTEIEKAEKELANLNDRQIKMKSLGVQENTKAWESLQYDINLTTQMVEDYKNEATGLEASGQAYTMGETTTQYDQLLAALESAKEKLLQMEAEVDRANDKWAQMPTLSGVIKQAFDNVAGAMIRAGTTVKTALTHPMQSVDRLIAGVAKKAARAAVSLKNMAAAGMKKLASGIKSVAANMIKLFGNTAKANVGFSGGYKSILKYGLGIRSLYLLVNKLRTALVSGYENLAQYSSETNKSISSMMSAMTQLKNSFAAAFAPILNVVAPILTKLIGLLSTAANYIGMFFAALTGSKMYTKAAAVQQDYAASLASTGTAAKDAAKDVTEAAKEEKRQLAGFDELNILSADKNTKAEKNDTDSAAGGAGGISPADMFETVSIDNAISDYVNKIKNAIAKNDWVGVGKLLADGLNLAFGAVDNWILGTLTPMGVLWAGRIADVLNGLVKGLDWTLIGKTIGDGLNAIVAIVNTFYTRFNFELLGQQFGTGLKSLFATVDWAGLGQFLTNNLHAILDVLHGFLKTFTPADAAALGKNISEMIQSAIDNINFKQAIPDLFKFAAELLIALGKAIAGVDWYQLGKDIADGLKNTDWGLVFDALCYGIGAVLGGLAGYLLGLVEDAWNSVVDWWNEVAYEDGKFTIEGLFQGILDALSNVGAWVMEHIVNPFLNGFAEGFGIHSPSTVMAEMGGYLIEGLFNGITGAWSAITGFFGAATDGLVNLLSGAWDVIKSGAATAWDGIKSTVTGTFDKATNALLTTSDNIKSGLSTAWENVKATATPAWENVKTTITGALEGAKTTLSTTSDNIKSGLSAAWDGVKTTASTAWTGVKSTVSTAFDDTKTSVDSTAGTMQNALSTAWSGIQSGGSTAWNNLKTTLTATFANAQAGLASTANTMKMGLSSAWDGIKSAASTTWNGIKSTLSSAMSGIKANMDSSTSSMISAISSRFSSMRSSMVSNMQNAANSIRNQSWYSIGSNICSGISSGINSGWSWLSNTVGSLARSLLSRAKSALGIHSPSRLFRDEVGLNIGYGVGEGVEASENSILDSVTSVTDAIADSFNSTEYLDGLVSGLQDSAPAALNTVSSIAQAISDGMSPEIPTLEATESSTVDGLDIVASKLSGIASVFERITEMLDRIGTLPIPQIATGTVVPYKTKVDDSDSPSDGRNDTGILASDVDERLADISYLLKQLIAIAKALNLNIDINALTEMVTQQQRSNLRNFGGA